MAGSKSDARKATRSRVVRASSGKDPAGAFGRRFFFAWLELLSTRAGAWRAPGELRIRRPASRSWLEIRSLTRPRIRKFEYSKTRVFNRRCVRFRYCQF